MADKDQPMNGEDFSQDVKDNEDVPMNGDGEQNGGGGQVRDDER